MAKDQQMGSEVPFIDFAIAGYQLYGEIKCIEKAARCVVLATAESTELLLMRSLACPSTSPICGYSVLLIDVRADANRPRAD